MTGIGSTRVNTKYAASSLLVAAGSVLLLPTTPAAAAVNGVATIARPGETVEAPLHSGGGSTPFTVALPANAACPGDTAHSGDHVYSYLVPAGTDLSDVTFVNFPSTGYGLVNNSGTYYGAINTAEDTGQIIGIPNDFEWGPLVTSDGGALPLTTLVGGSNHGVWEAGIACANTHGAVVAHWSTQVTFTQDASSIDGLSWRAIPGAAGDLGSQSTMHTTKPPAGPAATASTAVAGNTAVGAGTRAPVAGPSHQVGSAGSATAPGNSHGSAGTGGTDDSTVSGVPLFAIGAGVLVLAACIVFGVRRRGRGSSASAFGQGSVH